MAMSEALRRAAMARFDALEAKMFRSSKLCLAIAFQRLRFSFCRVYRWKARGQALQNGVRQVLPFPAVGELWGREESVGVFLNFRTRFLSFRNRTTNRRWLGSAECHLGHAMAPGVSVGVIVGRAPERLFSLPSNFVTAAVATSHCE